MHELIDSQADLDEITAHLVRAHAAGHDVARLCSGDPSLYSAVAEQARRLDAAGVPWDVTPGVPAYAAAAAVAGPGAHRARARADGDPDPYPGGLHRMPASESLEQLAATGATLVLHLAIRRTRELAGRLAGF